MGWPREVSYRPNFAKIALGWLGTVSTSGRLAANSLLLSKRLVSALSSKGIRTMTRGAFVVLEGLDRAGKSTQVSLLVQALKERSIPAEKLVFPDRSTAIGGIINDYLAKRIEYAPEVAHMLFSTNRWEFKDNIREALEKGTTLIVDRYAGSGAAYRSATTGEPLDRCRGPDRGLPAPDLVVYLDVEPEAQQQRAGWGEERFERAETQRRVAANFRELADPETWSIVEAGRDKEVIHREILEKVLATIETSKDKKLGKLYEDN